MNDEQSHRPIAENFARRFAPPELYDPAKRREWKLGRDDFERGPYVIELNLQHIEGLSGAIAALELLLNALNGEDPPPPPAEYISKTYARVLLTVSEWQRLLANDGNRAEESARDANTAALGQPGPSIPSVIAQSTSCGRTFQCTARSIVPWQPSSQMRRLDRSARAAQVSCGQSSIRESMASILTSMTSAGTRCFHQT
jgi:hypothetical protein